MFDLPFKFLTNIIVNYSIKTLKKEFEEILTLWLRLVQGTLHLNMEV